MSVNNLQYQDFLRNWEINLENPSGFSTHFSNLGIAQQELGFSSIQEEAVPVPPLFRIYLPSTNDRALNKILNGMTVSNALGYVDLLIKQRVDSIFPTVISTAPNRNLSFEHLSVPPVFLLPLEEPESSKEPTVFHEPTLNSTGEPTENGHADPVANLNTHAISNGKTGRI